MADSAIQSFLASYGQSERSVTDNIPHPPASCCCGNRACAYLTHNQSALADLERDVRTAAQLGQSVSHRAIVSMATTLCRSRPTSRYELEPRPMQSVDQGTSALTFSLQALLMRHEAYIAEFEKERKAMMAHIESLEAEKQAMEEKNANVIQENRGLLDQLETLNSAASEADSQVINLQATLQSTQLELQRLSGLAARTERLEQQLGDYEREQVTWQAAMESQEEATKSAVRRWQQAERDVADMQEQVERIEREARQEQERHTEVVGRMERRHAVERELDSAAGRLKGAAATRNKGQEPVSNSVVSHFVKDILSDNANLQMGIVELREMLQNSNDEVEALRRQLSEHQAIPDEGNRDAVVPQRPDLREELNRASSQELHVHHHYHAPPSANKKPALRRPKKKRYGVLAPGQLTPPRSGYSTPRSSMSYGTASSAATILQQTSVSIPHTSRKDKRFSTQSNQTYQSMLSSSGPSSPQSSAHRASSMFDRVFSDAGHESSRPTSPDTTDGPDSPVWAPSNPKRSSLGAMRTVSAPTVHRRGIMPGAAQPSMDSVLGTSVDEAFDLNSTSAVIPEEEESDWRDDVSAAPELDSSITSPLSDELLDPIHEHGYYRPPIRRAASHESLLSVHGMDIHTLKARPSQLLAGGFGGRSFTSGAVISDATAHAARPAAISRPSDSGKNLLSGVAAERRPMNRPSLGSKVGGWVFGRWATAPSQSTADECSISSSESTTQDRSADTLPGPQKDTDATSKKPKAPKMRPPGINQPGPIFGFPAEVRQQHLPILKTLDEEELKSALNADGT
ncbi:hypothetical protein D0864_15038 [Hortaea werneckii]|uniref:Uncharacterized protein n=1 Tax=Hortaea werneckii TaxID=91943 RepID=A0A3M7C6J0_HORWE|nr:hypothetical protein D0864_15038 [Hortaea werneckii]